MSSTMLQLVQQGTSEMGLSVPASVAGNLSTDTIQQLALMNACGYELQRKYNWNALTLQNIFQVNVLTLTANSTAQSVNLTSASTIIGVTNQFQVSGLGINQATYVVSASGSTIVLSQPATGNNNGATYTLTQTIYPMPVGFDRQIDCTHWDKSKHWQMLGPESAQQWEWLLSGYISTGPRIRYRILGGNFEIWPAVGVNEVLGFEYLTSAWAASSGGTAKTSFTADTDTCIYPDRLMVLFFKHKYFQVKGLGDIFESDFEEELGMAKTNDQGSPTLAMSPQASNVLITWNNIPDTIPQ